MLLLLNGDRYEEEEEEEDICDLHEKQITLAIVIVPKTMWKYVSRRLKDTLEKGSYHFEKRRTTALPNIKNDESSNDKPSSSICDWFTPRACNFPSDSSTKEKRWHFECLNGSWISAITWSGALIAGWYTTQIVNLRRKHPKYNGDKYSSINDICKQYINFVNIKALQSNTKCNIEKAIESLIPVVHTVPNDVNDFNKTSFENNDSKKSDSDLGDVLNSIENRLGLAAIESGQYQDGLNLLRSAANRNHAPALYNLAVCYETGVGVTIDEEMSMKLYRSAALLEHPGALYNLGVYYGQGRGGLAKDKVIALRLLRLAAVQGQKQALDAIKQFDIENAESQEDTSWSDSSHSIPILPNTPDVSPMFTVENVSYPRCFGVA